MLPPAAPEGPVAVDTTSGPQPPWHCPRTAAKAGGRLDARGATRRVKGVAPESNWCLARNGRWNSVFRSGWRGAARGRTDRESVQRSIADRRRADDGRRIRGGNAAHEERRDRRDLERRHPSAQTRIEALVDPSARHHGVVRGAGTQAEMQPKEMSKLRGVEARIAQHAATVFRRWRSTVTLRRRPRQSAAGAGRGVRWRDKHRVSLNPHHFGMESLAAMVARSAWQCAWQDCLARHSLAGGRGGTCVHGSNREGVCGSRSRGRRRSEGVCERAREMGATAS